MSALGKLVVPLAVAGAALLAASLAYASRGPVTLTVVSPIVDGTVIDSDDDGAGDWVFDAGSVVVGWGHPALGPGEMRGVFEFDVAALHGRCVENAQLFLNFAGSFGRPSPEVDPHFTLYASPGSGLLSAADYEGGTEIAQLLISDDVAVDVTAVL